VVVDLDDQSVVTFVGAIRPERGLLECHAIKVDHRSAADADGEILGIEKCAAVLNPRRRRI